MNYLVVKLTMMNSFNTGHKPTKKIKNSQLLVGILTLKVYVMLVMYCIVNCN